MKNSLEIPKSSYVLGGNIHKGNSDSIVSGCYYYWYKDKLVRDKSNNIVGTLKETRNNKLIFELNNGTEGK